MSHYKSNVRDLEFNLFEVFGAGERMGTGPFAEMDADTAKRSCEVDRLAVGPLAETFAERPQPPSTTRRPRPSPCPRVSSSRSAPSWTPRVAARLPEHLGSGAPPSLRWASSELMLGANPAAFYMSGPNFAAVTTPWEPTPKRSSLS